MRFSFYSHISKKLASARVLVGASLLALSPALGWAQTQYTTSQNFEANNGGGNLRFTATSTSTGTAKYFSGVSDNNDSPRNTPMYVAGSTPGIEGNSFGIDNNAASNNVATAQIDFRNVQLTGTATLTFRLAVIAVNGNGGLGSDGSILVGVNPDSAAAPTNYRPIMTLTGLGNGNGVNWSFTENRTLNPVRGSFTNPGTAIASSQTTTHYTQVEVTLNTLSQAKVRITLNASAKTRILIDDVLISSNRPLPVELVRFTAEAQEKNVALHWITASEKNSDYFEVQRSTNGETFGAIGKVQGEGTTSSISNYLFTDRAPVNGLAYYRLRQVDLDGTESYSPVQAVEWKGDAAVASFYPNPSAESITFTGTDGVFHYRIYNVKGQQVAIGEAASGSTVDLRAVPAGMYLLELSNKGQRSVQRFVRL